MVLFLPVLLLEASVRASGSSTLIQPFDVSRPLWRSRVIPRSRLDGSDGRGVDVFGNVVILRDWRVERRCDFVDLNVWIGGIERIVVVLECLKRSVRWVGVSSERRGSVAISVS